MPSLYEIGGFITGLGIIIGTIGIYFLFYFNEWNIFIFGAITFFSGLIFTMSIGDQYGEKDGQKKD